MPQLQAFCPVCQKTVTAHTVDHYDEVPTALRSKMDVRVTHIVRLNDGTSADHVWSLDDEAKNNLIKYLTGH